MTIFYHIVAVSTNGVIGNGDDLPWRIPSDLKYFKEKTEGKCCIVGRKTYETIKHLKNRKFVVVTRQKLENTENAIFVNSIDEALEFVRNKHSLCYIIGGAEIYRQTFDIAAKLFITYVEKTVEGDAFYKMPDGMFELKKSSDLKTENGNIFYFMEYDRTNKPKIADTLMDMAEYDEEHPNSGFRIDPTWTRDELKIQLKSFFDAVKLDIEKNPE